MSNRETCFNRIYVYSCRFVPAYFKGNVGTYTKLLYLCSSVGQFLSIHMVRSSEGELLKSLVSKRNNVFKESKKKKKNIMSNLLGGAASSPVGIDNYVFLQARLSAWLILRKQRNWKNYQVHKILKQTQLRAQSLNHQDAACFAARSWDSRLSLGCHHLSSIFGSKTESDFRQTWSPSRNTGQTELMVDFPGKTSGEAPRTRMHHDACVFKVFRLRIEVFGMAHKGF